MTPTEREIMFNLLSGRDVPTSPAAQAIWEAFTAAEERIQYLEHAGRSRDHEIEQILGKALGYPWYMDDQKNFPGATEQDGVCVGDHTALSLVDEAASRIKQEK